MSSILPHFVTIVIAPDPFLRLMVLYSAPGLHHNNGVTDFGKEGIEAEPPEATR